MLLSKTIKFYPDWLFLIIVCVVIAVCVGLYFIVPILNHKKYEQQRADLKNVKKHLKLIKKHVRLKVKIKFKWFMPLIFFRSFYVRKY